MKITTTAGHLTQTEKSHLKAIFNANLMEARANRKTYFITPDPEQPNRYQATINEKGRNDFGQVVTISNKVKFEIN